MLIHLFGESKLVNCFWNVLGDWIFAKLQVNIKLSKNHALFGFQEKCIDCKFLNNLMLVARFFIDLCKYFKLKSNMLEYFNVLNKIKNSQYIVAKRFKSIDKHCKK